MGSKTKQKMGKLSTVGLALGVAREHADELLTDLGAALVELHATDRMLTAWLGDFAMLPEGTEVRAECKRRRDAIRAAIARATGQEG